MLGRRLHRGLSLFLRAKGLPAPPNSTRLVVRVPTVVNVTVAVFLGSNRSEGFTARFPFPCAMVFPATVGSLMTKTQTCAGTLNNHSRGELADPPGTLLNMNRRNTRSDASSRRGNTPYDLETPHVPSV